MSRLFELVRNAHGRLVLHLADGSEHVGVIPVRAFPITASDEGLSLVGAEGSELLWIDRLDALPGAVRALIEEDLVAREFLPTIERIVSVSSFSTPSTWQLETDKGPATLVLKGEEDIRRLAKRTQLRISASDGVQFQIPDINRLDKSSRKLLERFL
ncbi:MAG: hypothetical protein ABS45_03585 [Comamonas sp. SCN 65-56]|uniref:cyanophycin metabolism-associated DUF1854 family protein n=1 Tax=Comamonas sp. SCN 65-56 TaxID=1660095 RepID=UPI000868CA5A|nr:DUF1854 domain-containing protein [Comamonas sp. SCN 65-56]ODS93286.1 MAG: hypothetical protein ABS45_03585 [Comamonas sp. SCN 65-56]